MTDIIVKDIKNGSEYYYGWSAEVSAEDVSYDNTTSGMTADNVQDALDEVFQSVSNGKELIADAITDKGVSTSASDSFQTMATNIRLIASHEREGNLLDWSLWALIWEVRYSGSDGAAVSYPFDVWNLKLVLWCITGNNYDSWFTSCGILAVDENGNKSFTTGNKSLSTSSWLAWFYVEDDNVVYVSLNGTVFCSVNKTTNVVTFDPTVPTGTHTTVSVSHTWNYPTTQVVSKPYFRQVLFLSK